ncbi:MAG: hypothetical protein NT167_28715, partial [Verrucomicrobia bacterium]|nr:hypothetical protein [Verrucomicrobiota bacterium]
EPLASLRYDFANEIFMLTNMDGYIVSLRFDTNTAANTFVCDLPLANGVNIVTLYATDLAGNISTNTYVYTIDDSSITEPPVFTLYWPQVSSHVSGNTFTLRGLLDAPLTSVTVQFTGADGAPAQTQGLVERDGLVWVENLPLRPGANTVTLTATRPGGHSASASLVVIQSDIGLTIDDLSTRDLNQPFMMVTGTVNADDYTVWVNGVKADYVWQTEDDTWWWQADNVPVVAGGTAVFQARALPKTAADPEGNGTGGGGGTASTLANPGNPSSSQAVDVEAELDKAPEVVKVHYDITLNTVVNPPSSLEGTSTTYDEVICYDLGQPGCSSYSVCWSLPPAQYHYWSSYYWDSSGIGTEDYPFCVKGSNICGLFLPEGSRPCVADHGGSGFCEVTTAPRPEFGVPPGSSSVSRYAHTRYELHTNGKQLLTPRKNLFVLTAYATGIANPFYPDIDEAPEQSAAYAIAPTQLVLPGVGRLGTDGRILKVLPGGMSFDVTPTVEGNPYYTFVSPDVAKYKPQILFRGNDVTGKTSTVWVGEHVNPVLAFDPAPPDLVTNYLWTVPGERVAFFRMMINSGTNIPLTRLTSSDVSYYWVDGIQSAEVECHVKIRGEELSARTAFEVRKPSADWIGVTNGLIFVDATCLRDGIPPFATAGMQFTFTNLDLKGYSGSFEMLSAQIASVQVAVNGLGVGGQPLATNHSFQGIDSYELWKYYTGIPRFLQKKVKKCWLDRVALPQGRDEKTNQANTC